MPVARAVLTFDFEHNYSMTDLWFEYKLFLLKHIGKNFFYILQKCVSNRFCIIFNWKCRFVKWHYWAIITSFCPCVCVLVWSRTNQWYDTHSLLSRYYLLNHKDVTFLLLPIISSVKYSVFGKQITDVYFFIYTPHSWKAVRWKTNTTNLYYIHANTDYNLCGFRNNSLPAVILSRYDAQWLRTYSRWSVVWSKKAIKI